MKNAVSTVVFMLSACAIVLSMLSIVRVIEIVELRSEWGVFWFWQFVLPYLGGGAFVLSGIPSVWLYARERTLRNLLSVTLSGISLIVIIGEAIVLARFVP